MRGLVNEPSLDVVWHELICHTDTPANAIKFVGAFVTVESDGLAATALIECVPDTIVLPTAAKPYRTDDLWKSTCFELFLTVPSGGYIEYNFSPSTQWAAYKFDVYREGMTPIPVAGFPPSSKFTPEADLIWVHAFTGSKFEYPTRLALSAVIEEIDGTKSYWALRHPPGPPDFHHPDCFALTLEAPPPA